MKRRVIFRRGLDTYVEKLKKIIDNEKERRNSFINNQVQYLPSHYWPQLKEMTPKLTLEGSPKEFDFPDFSRCSDIQVPDNLFASFSESSPIAPLKGDESAAQLEHIQEELENSKSKLLAKDSNISLLKTRLESKEQEITGLKA
jgi:hypothetical protein